MMTPQNARIWYISPKEPHNKTAYFVDAPYQVDKISAQTFADWQKKQPTLRLCQSLTPIFLTISR